MQVITEIFRKLYKNSIQYADILAQQILIYLSDQNQA